MVERLVKLQTLHIGFPKFQVLDIVQPFIDGISCILAC